jgi:hypothetical protein
MAEATMTLHVLAVLMRQLIWCGGEEIEEMTESLRETKAEGYHGRCLQSEGHFQSCNKVE